MLGTWFFAGFVNWTVNARSVLPLIPPAAILILRRLERNKGFLATDGFPVAGKTAALAAAGLSLAALVSFLVATSDAAWADSMREAANRIYQDTRAERGTVYFAGHWGFQYYMQALGFIPADELNTNFAPSDALVVPSNNNQVIDLSKRYDLVALESVELLKGAHAVTMCSRLGAGFYSSTWGPLPFAFGPVPSEKYDLFRLAPKRASGAPSE